MIKWKTLVKGILWELIGAVSIFIAVWVSTGDTSQSTAASIAWPVYRAITFYPYDRLFKRFWCWMETKVE